MGGFFSIEGPFYKFGSILADIMILSFLWIFFSLPLVTIGASTTALFYVTTKRISNKDGYLFRDFWKSFKENFKLSSLIWLIMLLITYIMITDIQIVTSAELDIMGNLRIFMYPFLLGIALELCLVALYAFPIISRFDMKLKDTIKTAFFMANKHLPTSILLLALFLAMLTAIYIYPLFFLICSGTYAYGTSYFFVRIFKKYRPELDSNEDLLRESSPTFLLDDEKQPETAETGSEN